MRSMILAVLLAVFCVGCATAVPKYPAHLGWKQCSKPLFTEDGQFIGAYICPQDIRAEEEWWQELEGWWQKYHGGDSTK